MARTVTINGRPVTAGELEEGAAYDIDLVTGELRVFADALQKYRRELPCPDFGEK